MNHITLEITPDEAALLISALDQLVRQNGLNAAEQALPLARRLVELANAANPPEGS